MAGSVSPAPRQTAAICVPPLQSAGRGGVTKVASDLRLLGDLKGVIDFDSYAALHVAALRRLNAFNSHTYNALLRPFQGRVNHGFKPNVVVRNSLTAAVVATAAGSL
jgi:hypothetical protein